MPREEIRPVLFSGENPVMRLFAPGSEEPAALASYWRATQSEHGEGSALLIWAGSPATHAIYADNEAVAQLVTERFNQYFARFKDHGFAGLAPQPARFQVIQDGKSVYRVLCQAADRTIDLKWVEFLQVYQMRAQNEFGGHTYEVTSTICPVRDASIVIDGTRVEANVVATGDRETSAFVAYAETWTGR